MGGPCCSCQGGGGSGSVPMGCSTVGVCASVSRLIKGAPLLRPEGCTRTRHLGTQLLLGLSRLGPTNDVGSHVTLTVVGRTRTSNRLGPKTIVVRPADNGANVNLTTVTTSQKCHVVLAVPRDVDIRQQGVLGTCKTSVILARSDRKVGKTVTGTRSLTTTAPNSFVPDRFAGPAGPETRCRAANIRV